MRNEEFKKDIMEVLSDGSKGVFIFTFQSVVKDNK